MYKTVERLGDNDSNSFFNAEQYIYESSMILQPDTYVTLILIINDMMIRDYDNKYFFKGKEIVFDILPFLFV